MSIKGTMARRLRLLFICLALGAVAPSPARAAYAEIASAPVAGAVEVAPADRAAVSRARPRHAVVRVLAASARARVSVVSRRYLVHQSLLL